MSKLPEKPSFLIKKNDEEKLPPIPELPETEVKKNIKKDNTKKISEPKPKSFPKIEIKISNKMMQFIILLCFCIIGYQVWENIQWKNKHNTLENKIVAFTNNLQNLNNENNSLSSKIVDLKRENDLFKAKENETKIMQEQLGKLNEELTTLKSDYEQLMKKNQENQNLIDNYEKKLGNKKQIKQTSSAVELKLNPLTNYESMLNNAKQSKCKEYFRNETLNRCNKYSKKKDYELAMEIKDDKSGIKKLLYKCVSSTEKVRYFNYGPLELFKACNK